MKNLVLSLTDLYGPSGREEDVKTFIKKRIESNSLESFEDPLGNLWTVKRKEGAKKILLAAHMDELGVIVTHIDDKGFLRFDKVGGILPHQLVGMRVIFPGDIIGVIGQEKIDKLKDLDFPRLYIDIGAFSKKEAAEKVKVGDIATFYYPCTESGSSIIGKALDDRAGCAVLLKSLEELLEANLPNEVYFVFTSQEEVGLRGAKTIGYKINPNYCLAVDVTRVGDTPEAPTMEVALGKGPAIKIKDSSMITSSAVKNFMIETAQQENIPFQLEVLQKGGTDAGVIHLTKEGIPSGVISIPCRYIHTPSEMVDLRDLEMSVRFLNALLYKEWHI